MTVKTEELTSYISNYIWKITPMLFWAGISTVFAIAFFLIRNIYVEFIESDPNSAVVFYALSLIIALLLWRVQSNAKLGPLSLINRGMAIFALIFLLLEPPVLPLVNEQYSLAYDYINIGWYISTLLAALAVWRFQSLLLPVLLYIFSHKLLYPAVTYFPASVFDIVYISESGLFVILISYLVFLTDQSIKKPTFSKIANFFIKTYHQITFAQDKVLVGSDELWKQYRSYALATFAMTTTGFHLANYFWSGFVKLRLNGGPTSWVLENPTANIIITNIEKGALPIAHWPWLVDFAYSGFMGIFVAMNVIVLFAQLAALPFVFHSRSLIILTIFLDFFHLGIYILGGLFFWPWIANNIIIAVLLHKYKSEISGAAPRLAAVLAIILGYASWLGDGARLAWYDVVDIRKSHLEAELKNGERVNVPLSYFMSMSYSASKGHFSIAKDEDHYPKSSWGAVYDYDRLKLSGSCVSIEKLNEKEYVGYAKSNKHTDLETKKQQVDKFFRKHHAMMLDRERRLGNMNIYMRGHHHPSNPFLYGNFNSISINDIQKYVVVTESVCLGLDKGQLDKKVLNRDEYAIYVK